MKVSIDGRIVDKSKACIPVLDHGLLYGDGVFEGIRVYNRRIFRLEDHLRRLNTSATAIHLKLPGGVRRIREQLLKTTRAFGRDNAYIRLLVTRGDGALGIDTASCKRPRVICIVDQVQLYPLEKTQRGIDMVTASVRRPSADVLDPRVKSLNYLNNVMARIEAKRCGADEALLLNQTGMIAEASAANIFIVRNSALFTPPVTDGALPGITRKTVIELASSMALSVHERSLGRYDIFGADEVFLTGSGARITKVLSLDGQILGNPRSRPITKRLLNAFDEFTQTTGTPIDG